ncbi:MAG TPA: hypothetical protein VFX98_15810, partial [Longimicrobiaceae bacterium]|nr:hypothetical protein [Longimicrobiaceae bacterium]
ARLEDSVALEATAYGAYVGLAAQLEPGWTLSAAVGGAASDRDSAETRPAWRAAVSSPGRYPLTATLAYAHRPLDETALLIRRDVEVDELSLGVQLAPGTGLVLAAAGGWAEYRGNVSGEANRRVHASLALTHRVARWFTLGAAVRSFAFERDLDDGYFDPDAYAIAEWLGRFRREWRRWELHADAAAGAQQVGVEGTPGATFRTGAGVAYLFGPGRRIGLSAAYANAGLSRLSPGDADEGYRYTAITLGGTWAF